VFPTNPYFSSLFLCRLGGHQIFRGYDLPLQPKFSELFISHLVARNVRVEADLVDQLFNSSEKRVARLLLLMANFGKEGRPEPVLAKISQTTLAEMIGTTRSRVNFFMNKFRKLGFIDYNGDLQVHNSLLNVILHDDPAISDPTKLDELIRSSQASDKFIRS